MVDLFNNRELSIALWLTALLLFLLSKPETRYGFKKLIVAFFDPHILIIFSLAILYILTLTYSLNEIGVWEFSHLKTTIYWSIGALILMIKDSASAIEKPGYIKKSIISQFELIAILSFISDFQTFPIFVELLIIPISWLFVAVQAYSDGNKEYKVAAKFSQSVLFIAGVSILSYSLYYLISSWEKIDKFNALSDLFVPAILVAIQAYRQA